ncbi:MULTISPECIES: hypothetical protein [unclassified Methanoculleus]|jgi:hypothetical protein|uniref:DUF1673 family protein n=1 Tax=Methanoculleus palmolei TaxID=72612 RepID=A0ABD8A988_9EURY|nr:hypothetical protein [Methanoculleus sp. UBA377]MDD2473131.1 hypothetical protein [Methanoculleus sp.]WOX55618.1 hypothetical protein R6Y95_09115 [Methanoculleus palmolei]
MALRFAEAIRRLMGWCPNAAMTGRRCAALEVEVETAKEGGREVVEGALVDYGSIGTPGRLFLLLLASACFIGCFFAMTPATLVTVPTTSVMFPAGGLLLLAIALGCAALELYGTVRRARIDIAHDVITINRTLFRPLVIPRDAIEKAEVGENKLPVPLWLLVVALAALFTSAAGSVYTGFGNPASMRFLFGLAAAVLFPALFYRTYVRTRYPQALAITTTKKRIAVIYTDDPERVVRTLGVAG